MKKSISLWLLLSIIFIVTLLTTNTILYGLILKENTDRVQKEEEQLLLSVGKQVALEPEIKSALLINESSDALEQYTLDIAEIYNFDFVVIMNMEGIRLTHPSISKIGQPFEGGDETTAMSGKEHISISKGTLGDSLRGFVPIFEDSKQIGVVALGIKLTSLDTLVKASRERYAFSLIISVGIALFTSTLVAYYLKRQLLNLEPKEITKLLEERNAMLNETKDVVVVIDRLGKITLANTAAKEFYLQLGGNSDSLEGQLVDALIQDKAQLNFTRNAEQLYRQNGQDYLFYIAPILVRKQAVGSIIFLRDATESLFVMDQLASTTSYVSALQNQSHEFMNKLHVIYGLVDLAAYNELKIYLNDILNPEETFTNSLSILVKNPMIAVFLVGEQEKFSKYGIDLAIELFSELPDYLDQKKTITIISLYRYIHHVLLQQELPEKLPVTIDCTSNLLTSSYILTDSTINTDKLSVFFQENYFKELLKDAEGTFTIETQSSGIILILKTSYEGGAI
ncbi:sensor histidine kinase [Enterococcus sp. BWT-B8]|uniref:Spo0B domain-containing protein n=1 Tax=unclassified Enterococcus TaxID=2608891 RepID=UPI001E34595C|nr:MULTISPECIES: sensor histidine kinase [unclassified Enterococcus]MCB5953183.1 sensor histidine kinase [Enterococcus sp. BWT-B8]MCB5953774.1 sensor histidine kinase [Enterococcus sp. CWB-B31]